MDHLLGGLRAAAEPTRLRVLALCAHAELTVTELTQILGQSQPRVSRHLKLLCEAGLLDRYREGTWAFYRLSDDGACARLSRAVVDLVPSDDPVLSRDLQRLDAVKSARARAAADYFRANAERWDEIRALYVPEDDVENTLLDIAGREIVDDLLDIGTGTGRIIEVFAPYCRRGLGIDLSRDMLRVARANLEQQDIRHCQVRQGDMYNLAVENGSIDLTILHQVLHFAEDPAAAIREAGRVLKPGGRLLVVDFARHELAFLRDEHQHHWLGFDESEVARWLFAAGLENRATQHMRGDPLTVRIWQARRPRREPLRRADRAAAVAANGR